MIAQGALLLFGLLIILLGVGLLIYSQLLGFLLRFHILYFDRIHAKAIKQLENQYTGLSDLPKPGGTCNGSEILNHEISNHAQDK